MQNYKHRRKWFAPHLSQKIKMLSSLYEENVDSNNRAQQSKEIRLQVESQPQITMGLSKS